MHTSRHRQRTLVRLVLALLVAAPVLVTGAVFGSAAAAAGPQDLLPGNGDTVAGSPVFSWTRISGATAYDVEIYDGVTKLTSVTDTVNNRWVPNTVELPTGKSLTWRVRGSVAGVESEWSQVDAFSRGAVTAPTQVAPADDATLNQPGQPLVFSWIPVPGAVNYTVEVGPDEAFVDPSLVTSYTTATTTLAPNVIPPGGTYYWRVTANLKNNVKSEHSAVRSYVIVAVVRSGGSAALAATPVFPADNQTIEDVVLDWNPLDGAATYKLQVSTDSNFLTKVIDTSGIKSTRYSPITTLDNDQYWWRVAGVNADGIQTPWESSAVWRFTRRWDKQVSLTYPADGAAVGDPFHYEWTPASLASKYVIDVSTNASFTPSNTVQSCTTVHTTYTPSQGSTDCWPGANGIYYWRVRAFDGTADITSEVVNGQVHSFHYDPDLITLLSPADSANVTVPTFSWARFDNASKYRITLTPAGGGSTKVEETVTTTFTWPTKLTAGSYSWQVQPVFKDNRVGTPLFVDSQRVVHVSDPSLAAGPSPDAISAGAPDQRPPLLTWTPVTGANRYRIFVRISGSGAGYTDLGEYFEYPSGSDINGAKLDPATYEWRIQAYNSSTPVGSLGAPSTYTILPFDAVADFRAAMTGTTLGSDFCVGSGDCGNLRQTPALRWGVVPGAASYKVLISNDVNLTNPVVSEEVLGVNQWMNPAALPDAYSGSAYYWQIVPCGPTGVCKTVTAATHQFNKQGVAVATTGPGLTLPLEPGAELPKVANDITFNWNDYLGTVQAAAGGTNLTTSAAIEARSYRIQVSDLTDFSNLLDNKVVDQRTYTPFDRTYPEQPLYWRVAAIDGSGNALPWSAVRAFEKSSPGPALTSGHNGTSFNGSATLGWAPLAYAKTYNLQIFASGANPEIDAPLVTGSGLKQNSFTLVDPLPLGGYQWRVRRADADNRFGQWSALGTFTSAAGAPTLQVPANGAEVEPRGAYFSWTAPVNAAASSYRITLTPASGSPVVVTTLANAYAPTARLADSTWTWKVEALDSKGASSGTSATRTFTVAGTLTPTGPVTISGTGKVGSVLTAQPVSWNRPGTTTTYQWYRNTNLITGATASQYTVVQDDFGKAIKVRVIGVNAGYDGGAGTDSNTITGVAGDALIVVNNPSYAGTRSVGQTLTATPGTWTTTNSLSVPTTYKYQWLRNGGAITGATSKTYQLVPLDAARSISVRVTATATGYAPGTATSAGGTVAKISSTTAVKLKASRIKRGTRGTVYVTVTAALPRSGTIRIYDGTRLIKSVTLYTSNGGKKTVRLPLLRVGRHRISARYLGNGQINPSSSARVTLTVTR